MSIMFACQSPIAAAVLQLLLAAVVSAQHINVTVDDVSVSLKDSGSSTGERYTLGKLKRLAITCRASSSGVLSPSSFFWRLENSNSSATVDARITVDTKLADNGLSGTSVLNINYPVKSDITNFVCIVNQTASATGRFLSAPLLTMKVDGANEYDVAMWPGESVAILCLVEGNPMGDIRWTKSVDPAFNLTNNNTLYLSSVSYEADRGYITCASKNRYGENTARLFLRVKSPLSFLTPLVAIGCEIVAILVIVVVYELYDKRRRQVVDGDDPKSE
ncbi:hypothetical protein BOX15_Mlig024565g1 [Macrostomum lignano]|uniref:Ig-like domain-containing protein n=1 Tax=Macrostomum lignano TaxID=282301 RepID=A0A267FF85_9PLAT|nr:hypothetical protein BOX15_Mlig024565g1 [Macrostomum lignano]